MAQAESGRKPIMAGNWKRHQHHATWSRLMSESPVIGAYTSTGVNDYHVA
jgi:hypothetical protein